MSKQKSSARKTTSPILPQESSLPLPASSTTPPLHAPQNYAKTVLSLAMYAREKGPEAVTAPYRAPKHNSSQGRRLLLASFDEVPNRPTSLRGTGDPLGKYLLGAREALEQAAREISSNRRGLRTALDFSRKAPASALKCSTPTPRPVHGANSRLYTPVVCNRPWIDPSDIPSTGSRRRAPRLTQDASEEVAAYIKESSVIHNPTYKSPEQSPNERTWYDIPPQPVGSQEHSILPLQRLALQALGRGWRIRAELRALFVLQKWQRHRQMGMRKEMIKKTFLLTGKMRSAGRAAVMRARKGLLVNRENSGSGPGVDGDQLASSSVSPSNLSSILSPSLFEGHTSSPDMRSEGTETTSPSAQMNETTTSPEAPSLMLPQRARRATVTHEQRIMLQSVGRAALQRRALQIRMSQRRKRVVSLILPVPGDRTIQTQVDPCKTEPVANVPMRKLIALTPQVLLEHLNARGEKPSHSLQPTAILRQGAVLFIDISGYTRVGDALRAQYGASEGAERLSAALNTYFTAMVNVVIAYGADVPLFSGDAFAAAFLVEPHDAEGYKKACNLGLSCAAALLRDFGTYIIEQTFALSLHMGLACGDVCYFMVGDAKRYSHDGGMRLILTGKPLFDAAQGVNYADSKELAVHESIQRMCRGLETFPLSDAKKDEKDGSCAYALYLSFNSLPCPQLYPLTFPEDHHGVEFRKSIAAFVTPPALDHVERSLVRNIVGKMRAISCVFICMHRLSAQLALLGPQEQLELLQKLFNVVQLKLMKYGGSCNKLFVDDKGVLVVCAFGLPGFVHVDSPSRALRFALEVTASFWKRHKLQVGVGVTTATAFVGRCGAPKRYEYTILGDSVNVAARLMSHAISLLYKRQSNGQVDEAPGIVLCDLPTHKSTARTCPDVDFGDMDQIRVRNKIHPIPVLLPTRRPKDERPEGHTKVLGTAKRIMQADRCALFLVNEQEQTLTGVFEDMKSFTLPRASGIVGHVATSGETVNIPEAYNDPRFCCEVDKATGYRTHSVLCLPVRETQGGPVVAVAQLLNKHCPDTGAIIPFTASDEELFETFSAYIVTCLQNADPGSPRGPLTTGGCEKYASYDSVIKPPQLFECSDSLASLSDFIKSVRDVARRGPSVFDIVGESGCGKTTFLQHTLGLLQKLRVPFFYIPEGGSRQQTRPYSAICAPLQKVVDRHQLTGPALSFLGLSEEDVARIVCLVEVHNLSSGHITSDNIHDFGRAALLLLQKILGGLFVIVADGLEVMDAMSADFVLQAATSCIPVVVARRPYDCVILPPWSVTTVKRMSLLGKRGSVVVLPETPRDGEANSDNDTERVSRIISRATVDSFVAGWRALLEEHSSGRVVLLPVGKTAFHAKFCEMIGAKDVEQEITAALYLKCEGNLGFACEILRALCEAKQVEVSEEGVARSTMQLDMSQVLDEMPSVQASYVRSLDSLRSSLVDVLAVASVLGTVFSADLLKKSCAAYSPTSHHDAATIDTHLEELSGLQMIGQRTAEDYGSMRKRSISVSQQSSGSREYKFIRPLLRDASYNQMLPGERQHVHRIVACLLTSETGVEPWIVAYHHVRSNDVRKGIDVLHLAACAAHEAKNGPACQQYVRELVTVSQKYAIPLTDEMRRIHAMYLPTSSTSRGPGRRQEGLLPLQRLALQALGRGWRIRAELRALFVLQKWQRHRKMCTRKWGLQKCLRLASLQHKISTSLKPLTSNVQEDEEIDEIDNPCSSPLLVSKVTLMD